MKIWKLTSILFNVNKLVDMGKTVSPNDIKKAIEDGKLFDFLEENFKDEIDLSLYKPEDKEKVNKWVFEQNGVYDRERRKAGVEINGLCFLIAYLTELIQNPPEPHQF